MNCKSPFALREAELREQIARADLLELKRKECEGELVNMAEAIEKCVEIVQPVARMVKDMPARLCQRCNPSDPTQGKRGSYELHTGGVREGSRGSARNEIVRAGI